MLHRWRPILRYLPRYRLTVLLGVVALVLGNVCMVRTPEAMREGVRAIEQPWRAGAAVDVGEVAGWAAIAVAITLAGAAASFFKRHLLMRTSRRVEADLRRDLFHHIQRLPMAYFDRVRTGDLMSRVTADLEAARMAIGPAFMYLADSVVRFGFALDAMLRANASLTLLSLVPLVGIAIGLLFLAPRIHRASRAVQDTLAAISARSQESFAGARVVKTFALEPREQEEMDALGEAYVAANVRLARVRGLTTAWLGLMGAGGLAVILLVGGRHVIEGRFDYGGMLMFTQLQVMLVWPMMAFGWVLSLVQRGAAGMDRIGEVLTEREEPRVPPEEGTLRGAIEFRGLDFAFDGSPVLSGIGLEVPAGATLGVVGPVGSGKSTLAALLTRLYDPPRGTLFVDGRDVLDYPLSDLRRAIAVVPQEAFLFSTTILENIAFGRPEASEEWLAVAARDAHLHRDLETFPLGIRTVVGERGVTLSGGQKQRTALARALASDAPILVLDDALSAVDTETEATILANLRRVGRNRTVIVIAHRVSAVRHADRIVYLRDGRIVESGTHDELLRAGGAYARLARAQAIEEEIEEMRP